MTTLSKRYRSAVIATLFVSLAACAGIDPPYAEISKAEASIAAAERDGGQEFSAPALQSARTNLAAAQRAVQNDNNKEAGRLAAQADVDAQLAQAQIARGKSEVALKEINQGLNTLHGESVRNVEEVTRGTTH